jgi:hypothetical protein
MGEGTGDGGQGSGVMGSGDRGQGRTTTVSDAGRHRGRDGGSSVQACDE